MTDRGTAGTVREHVLIEWTEHGIPQPPIEVDLFYEADGTLIEDPARIAQILAKQAEEAEQHERATRRGTG
jgi:hypothetical protein